MPYIASTLSADTFYAGYENKESNGANIPAGGVLVKGGANVADKRLLISDALTVPAVISPVTDDELEFLKNDATFKTHLAYGSVKILERKAEVEVVARDMKARDDSAPLTDADYQEGGRMANSEATPVVPAKEKKGKKGKK